MKKKLLFGLLLSSVSLIAQNKIELKKGDLLSDGQKVASIDSKGGVMNTNRNFWVFAPDAQDTLLTISQVEIKSDNPMFESWVYYKVNPKSLGGSQFYIKNPPGWGYVGEKKVFGLLFNDNLPLIIENGKINTEKLDVLKRSIAYNYDSMMLVAKQLGDTTLALTKSNVARNRKGAYYYKTIKGKNLFPRLYVPQLSLPEQTKIEIYQDSTLIGVVEKDITAGGFAKGHYIVYKNVSPIVINGVKISMLPIAFANTSPGMSNVTLENIPIFSMDSKRITTVPPAGFNEAEDQIVKGLVYANML